MQNHIHIMFCEAHSKKNILVKIYHIEYLIFLRQAFLAPKKYKKILFRPICCLHTTYHHLVSVFNYNSDRKPQGFYKKKKKKSA